MSQVDRVEIDFGISNYYGGLEVKQDNGKYYWGIRNEDTIAYKEIPKYLYDALIQFWMNDL